MTPSQGLTPSEMAPGHGDQVVISGMSGVYPKSRCIKDLEHILYNKINPITTDDLRWSYDHPEAAQYAGNVPDLDRFDAQFFKVHYRLGHSMDPMSRKILEQAYEAIYDAGVNPEHLSGKNIGVYIGTCFSETEKACFYSASSRTGFGIAGCNKSMFANRISYWLNAKGPSLSIDDACCSATAALEQAYLAMTRGECEAAIVGGAYLCLHPQSSVHYERIMNLSKNGKTKSFQPDAGGCAQSEAVNVLFLQKAKDALRIYADVVNVQCEFVKLLDGETGPLYGFCRDPEDSARFLKMFYERAGVSPNAVQYVEAFGSAMPDADKSELETIDKIFCSNRDDPLIVGSVMSNIGYGGAASGISAITKVLIGYHRGELAGNLNYETPRSNVDAIREGRIQVLSDHRQFRGTYAGVNSMSVTGVNAHVLLHSHYKPKDLNRYKSNIPYLVTMSGRQDTSVKRALTELQNRPIDPEQLALLQSIHQTRISAHLGRGYAIFDTKEGKTVSLSERVDYFDDVKRPLWFVYSGMGSQWAGMGSQLMRIPIFAAAIERCNRVLAPKGLDIVSIITSPDKKTFDNILHSFVGIAAVQIGLTDILQELGLVPDNIIGHSVGELGCAYADGCLSAEEMILAAYSRGLVSLETPFIKGSMAAVGLGFQEVSKLCPPEIEIACHNSSESCTISGPADAMKAFVSTLVAKEIFAKEVPSSNIAYHSRYIAEAGPGLLKYLKEVINTPKARSEKWLSTSVPQERWNEEQAMFSSAEYHTNNLLSPVLFEETSALIPSNAVLVEIAPHGLLQAILKRSLPDSCTNIPLTRRGNPDGPCMLLDAVGKLYMEGYNLKVQVLYPKVEFPVSTGTPYLSDLVDWAHHEKWPLALYASAHREVAASCNFVVSVHDDEHSYLRGHVLRAKTLVPFSYALVAVWDTLAMTLNVPKKQLDVEFSDVHLFAQPVLLEQGSVTLFVSLHRGSGRFEVMDGVFKVASGFINSDTQPCLKPDLIFSENKLVLSSRDVYQLLSEREYGYSGEFRSILRTDDALTEANIQWNGNWVTFIDGILQLNALKHLHHAVSQPKQIRRMAIDVTKHTLITNKTSVIKANVSDVNDLTRCGGVLIENLKFHNLPLSNDHKIDLKTLRFVPRFQSNINTFQSLQIFIQIIAENINKDIIKVCGISSRSDDIIFGEMERVASNNIPGIGVEYTTVHEHMSHSSKNIIKEADAFVVQNLSNDDEIVRLVRRLSRNDIFIINQEPLNNTNIRTGGGIYKVVSILTDSNTNSQIELVRFQPTLPNSSKSVVVRSEKDLLTLITARNKLPSQCSLIVLSSYPPLPRLRNMVKQWRNEPTRNNINLIMINDNKDTNQLAKLSGDLAYNIMYNGDWGGEYYLPLKESFESDSEITLRSAVIGDLASLQWVDAPTPPKRGVSVKVHYAGIYMNDVLRASGIITTNEDNGYGMEFSGVTERGDRVMGLVPHGAMSSHVVAQPEFLWPVPEYWNLEDAATVPLAYALAYYCLRLKIVKVVDSKSVLVHGGAGAVGQAIISVSLASGYRVFTTVGDMQKKKFLLRLFPQLKEEDIGNSRDSTFVDLVLSATGGLGCKIVICCLKDDLKNASFKCAGSLGQTFDMVQLHNHENFNLGMHVLTMDRSYSSVDISSIFHSQRVGDVKMLHALISEGIVKGEVRPLSRVTFAPEQVSRAFRLLGASRHRGRVLLRLQERPPAHTRLTTIAEGSHIVFCDNQPLGLQLTDMLVNSGAEKIHLHFAQIPALVGYKQRMWKRQNVQISISSEDLNVENGVQNFLQNIKNVEAVYGIYLANDIMKQTTLLTMDVAARKVCPDLKKFLIFSNGNDYGRFISLKRVKDGLPATVVDLPMLETVEDEGGALWFKGIKEATEQALLSSHSVFVAQLKDLRKESLVQQITKLTDIKISEVTSPRATLETLGFQTDKSGIVASFLRDVHNISIEEALVSSLTIERLKEIEEKVTETNKYKEIKGLGTFFSYVDPDELLATTEMVFLSCLTQKSSMRGDEFNANQTVMCIVPGLEGHHKRFESLCERLKLPTIVLQPGLDHLQETVEELALRYSEVILNRAGLKNNFYLVGYETGVLVALELAAILERHGQTGTMFCIGDGPEEIKSFVKQQLRGYESEEALQTALVHHMFSLMTGGNAPAEGAEGATWKQRVDTCVRTLLGQVSHSAQYARSLLEAALVRIVNTISYDAEPKVLQSKIVLLRALSSTATAPCSLQRYSTEPISIYNLTTPLVHTTRDMRCASIINKHLAQDILDAFDTKNLCDTYILAADTFMITN